MTAPKVPIDEQIAKQKYRAMAAKARGSQQEEKIEAAILATLQSIKDAEDDVVEPPRLAYASDCGTNISVVPARDYDTLQAKYKQACGERKRFAEYVCRLRGEHNADEDLKRFVDYVDHAMNLSSGAVSKIFDFAQGQKLRAEKAEAERDEFRKYAERYRWLRDVGQASRLYDWFREGLSLEQIDAAIDEARNKCAL